jgi:hypothetical protein
MRTRHQLSLSIVLLVILSSCQMRAQASDEKVLYRKALSESGEIVVSQSQVVPLDGVNRLLPQDTARRLSGCYTLSVDFQSRGKPPVRLWARMHGVAPDATDRDQEFVDLLALPGRIVLAKIVRDPTSGFRLPTLIQIGLVSVSDDCIYNLRGCDWSMTPGVNPAERVSLKLKYDENEKRVEAQVTQNILEMTRHTIFAQTGEKQEFVRVKQWDEKIPSTNPASERR